MTPLYRWAFALSFLSSTGCATAKLSLAGERVEMVSEPPSASCVNLGVVIGTGGGAVGGSFVSNAKLLRYAMNDVRNQAAAKGATHLQMSDPQFGTQDGTTTTATVSAIAYRCAAPVVPLATPPTASP